jgi:cyclophilin family peptidyl-prolyl cis-trans isomerase
VAGTRCSVHVKCNLEEGKKRLNERLQSALKLAGKELDREIRVREPQLALLQAAHHVWKSGLAEHLEEQINAQSMALTVARSKLESLNSLKDLQNKDDPSIIVSAINDTEALVTSIQSRLKVASKQATLLTALQICDIIIQPVLDNHDKNKYKLQNLMIDVGANASNEEKALVYLMYHILENRGGERGTVNGSWQLVDKPKKVKSRDGEDNQIGNKSQVSKARSSSVQRAGRDNLVCTVSSSTESLPAAYNTKITLNRSSGKLKKGAQCFIDIAIGGKVSGRIVIQLRPDVAPKMCANFVALCTGELGYGYRGSKIFKAIADDYILGGDFEKNDGSGGHSIYNHKNLFIADDCGLRDEKGAVRMKGMGTDEKTGGGLVGSQFHIWVGDRDFKSFIRTLVIGKVTEGLELCRFISNFKTYKNDRGTFIINNDVVIQNCGKL